MAEPGAAPPLGKFLASTEKKVRDKAVKNLTVFLSNPSRDGISTPDMDRLWKGIFYGFWMSDKPLVQQALASELAELVLTISTATLSISFLRGFWQTIVREWNGIDRLRMDKYYMLVRRFVNASFRLLVQAGWQKDVCQEYNDLLIRPGGPLCPSDPKIPTSLVFHLADIYIEELDKVLAAPPNSARSPCPTPLYTLIHPFLILAARVPSGVTYKHIQSALFDPLFSALSCSSTVDDPPPSPKRARLYLANEEQAYPHVVANACYEDPLEEGKVDGPVLRRKLLKSIFEVASQPETRDSNRRKMYTLWKEGGED